MDGSPSFFSLTSYTDYVRLGIIFAVFTLCINYSYTALQYIPTKEWQEPQSIQSYSREQAIAIAKSYRVRAESKTGCKTWLGREVMDEDTEFKNLGTVLCKHGSLAGEVMERAVIGRQVIGALEGRGEL